MSFDSFTYEEAEPSAFQRFFLEHPEINVAEFAKKEDVIATHERGKATPRRENLILLAEYFGVTVAYLEGTTSIEDIENMLNAPYTEDTSVRDMLGICMEIAPNKRKYFKYIASLMAKDNDGNED